MNKIFNFGIKLINQLTFPKKFILISLFVFIPFMGTIYLFFSGNNSSLEFNQQERYGVEYNAPLKETIVDLQAYREKSSEYLQGNTSLVSELETLKNKLKTDADVVATEDKKLNETLSVGDKWNTANSKIQKLISASNISANDNFNQATEAISDLLVLHAYISDKSNLTLDPDLDSYYCMDVTMFRQMPLSEKLNRMKNLALNLTNKAQITPDERKQLIMLSVDIKTLSDTIDGDMQTALRENKSKSLETTKSQIQQSLAANNAFLELINSKMIDSASVSVKANELIGSADNAIANNSKLYDEISKGLDGLLKVRVDSYASKNYIVIVTASIALPIFLYLYIAFSLSIIKSISNLKKGIEKVASGDLVTRVEVKSKDEISDLAKSFNVMVQEQANLMRMALETAQKVSQSVKLLDVATDEMSANSTSSKGNIDDVTNSIESLETAIDSVATSSGDVSKAVGLVSVSISEMGKSVEDIANSIQNAVESINSISTASVEMSESIVKVAKDSENADSEAGNMVKCAEEGKHDVEKTISEMDKISSTIEGLSTAVTNLGTSASEINEIVNVINDIAEQTNLLALNAAIEAARAGESGKGFAVVASAIRELSERSHESTSDIIKLISNIQKEVETAISKSKDGSVVINHGVSLVKNTGVSFENIFEVVKRTSTIIKNITKATQVQADQSAKIVNSIKSIEDLIQNISAITEEQAAGVGEIERASDNMAELTHKVNDNIQVQSNNSHAIVEAVKKVNESVKQISTTSDEIAVDAENLTKQSETLLDTISKYKFN